MTKQIHISIDDTNTKLELIGHITELDVFLATATLFDRLTPKAKKLLISKLQNISSYEEGYMLESVINNKF